MNVVSEHLQEELLDKAERLRAAAHELAKLEAEQKNEALFAMAGAIQENEDKILTANSQDLVRGEENGLSQNLLDRLRLSPKRLADMAEGLRQVAVLPDPVGQVLESWERPNGLHIQKVSVPLGVVGMIYEARPNVTVDAAGLCLKAGNAVMLRGGSAALYSNTELVEVLKGALERAGVPRDAIQLIQSTDRQAVHEMLQLRGYLDVVIPRGGAELIQHVVDESKVPVIETGVGNCHLYVSASAKPQMAVDLVVNAKTQRPSVCNAVETVLVHRTWAERYLSELAQALRDRGVLLKGCDAAQKLVADMEPAEEEDWRTEYLNLTLAVKVVGHLDEAMAHIARYGTHHSEGIVTEDAQEAARFLQEVDAAVVYHNASTRFSDGFEFGFGAEIGISTQKLHARGPMGLTALTSYKYQVRGYGQVRH